MSETYTCKFGGTSLATAERVQHVANMIRGERYLAAFKRRFIVVSAPGKRDEGDAKVTDLLYLIYNTAELDGDTSKLFDRVHDRFRDVVRGFGHVDASKLLDDAMSEIREEFPRHVSRPDWIVSRGEWLMAKLFALAVDLPFVDAAPIIRFSSQRKFQSNFTLQMIGEELGKSRQLPDKRIIAGAVIPGFYGGTPEGDIVTFTRGGSDLTGSLIACGTKSDLYENWTDVDGLMTADPRIVPNARPVEELSYRELRELALRGASVFQDEAVIPMRDSGKTIHIRNSFKPEAPGTKIMHESNCKKQQVVTGIAGKKGFSVISVHKMMMDKELGIGRRLLSILADEDVSFKHMPGDEDSLCVVVENEQIEGKEVNLLAEIKEVCKPDNVVIIPGLALISAVGHGMRQTPGVAAKLFTALADAKINTRMIVQGASELNIIIGVNESDFEEAMRAIHNAFF